MTVPIGQVYVMVGRRVIACQGCHLYRMPCDVECPQPARTGPRRATRYGTQLHPGLLESLPAVPPTRAADHIGRLLRENLGCTGRCS